MCISAFVVHADDEGFSVAPKERKLGIHGSPTREILFDNCRIPADRIVGEPGTGFQTAMRTLDHTRITIGAQALGIARAAYEYALDYAKERKAFGRSIIENQSIAFKLASSCRARPDLVVPRVYAVSPMPLIAALSRSACAMVLFPPAGILPEAGEEAISLRGCCPPR